MSVFTNTNSTGKNRWTKEQDALLIKMANEGKSRSEISKGTGHPENSITYRIRFIKKAEEDLSAKLFETGEEIESVDQVLASIKY